MAKRFTDSKLGRRAWYRKLPPRLKCAWEFLYRECDGAGVWSIDEEALAFHIGEPVHVPEMLDAFNSGDEFRLTRVGPDKLLLVGFIAFQYGALSEDCKPHKPVIKRLQELNLWEGYGKGFQRLKDKEEEKEKEKYKEKEEEKDKDSAVVALASAAPPSPVSQEAIRECTETWKRTLKHFGGERELLAAEQTAIVRAIQRYGDHRSVALALVGPREQPKGESFNPGKFLSLDKVLSREKFNWYLNLGTQWLAKKEGRAS